MSLLDFVSDQIAALIPAAPGWRVLAYEDDGAGKPKESATDRRKAEVVWHEVTHWGLVHKPAHTDDMYALFMQGSLINTDVSAHLVPMAGTERLDKVPHFICVVGPSVTNDGALDQLDSAIEQRRARAGRRT